MSVELVYGLSLAEVRARYRRQPTRAEVEADPTLTRLGPLDADYRPPMNPRVGRLLNNTLQRRDFDGGTWQERHQDCFLVVTHDHTKSTTSQQRDYTSQDYALAVEMADETSVELDLHTAVRQRLQARIRR
jgi:ferric-dicitrate binding protein FerR (iron transport regulator)